MRAATFQKTGFSDSEQDALLILKTVEHALMLSTEHKFEVELEEMKTNDDETQLQVVLDVMIEDDKLTEYEDEINIQLKSALKKFACHYKELTLKETGPIGETAYLVTANEPKVEKFGKYDGLDPHYIRSY